MSAYFHPLLHALELSTPQVKTRKEKKWLYLLCKSEKVTPSEAIRCFLKKK